MLDPSLVILSLVFSSPEINFLRSILRKLHYEIPKDLQCRLYVLFLGVDSTVVPSLADSTWKADNVNNGILEEYIHCILPRFTKSCRDHRYVMDCLCLVVNEKKIIEDVLWVIHGLIINTGASYNHCISLHCKHDNLVMTVFTTFLLVCRDFSREFVLLFMLSINTIEFFSTENADNEVQSSTVSTASTTSSSRIPQSSLLNPAKDVCINQEVQLSQTVRLPLFSISRGKASIRIHSILRILVEFFDPSLSAQLAFSLPSWWRPFSYPIELQDDFISVSNWLNKICIIPNETIDNSCSY